MKLFANAALELMFDMVIEDPSIMQSVYFRSVFVMLRKIANG